FDGGNASSARSLMQRGLRINPTAQNLWLQYFRLEFSYVEKLMGRREILGLEEEGEEGPAAGTGSAVGGDARGGREEMDIPELEAEKGQSGGPSFKSVKKAAAGAAAAGASSVGNDGSARPAPVMNDTARRFYKGAVPMAVFRAAIKAVPGEIGFRAGFLRCCAADFPVLAQEAAQAVLASIERDFPDSCEAWELRAEYPLLVAEAGGGGMVSAVEESADTFERAVEAVGTTDPDMWVRYASFLRGRLEACEERAGSKGGGGGGHERKGGATVLDPAHTAAAAILAARLREVLARAVKIHLAASEQDGSSSAAGVESTTATPTTVVAAAIAARKERGGASLLATRGVSTSAEELRVSEQRRAEDAREALSAGLADVCLALGKPDEALAALRAATGALPRRPGPWLRRAALERRLAAVSDDQDDASPAAGGRVGGQKARRGGSGRGSNSSAAAAGTDAAVATLRAGLRTVPAAAPGYPSLWRELIASMVAAGCASKRRAVAAAFRGAVEACDPSSGDRGAAGGGAVGSAQGEFLAGYIRWSAAMEGVGAARRALQWARRSFLLSGAGAAAAYNEAIELERALGGEDGAARAKRVRELFEDAADKFGKELPGIWEEYAGFETQEGDLKRANAVRWRSQQQQQQQKVGAAGGSYKKQRRR
ncbi:unnamed protein product, partial [Hapterophycus canaliculatus]